jgi:predicted nuclease with TOPRIM domain
MEDSMTYQRYSTLQKVEQLVKMVQRNPRLKEKLNGNIEDKLYVLNLVGLEPSELEEIKNDLDDTFVKASVSIWVPT